MSSKACLATHLSATVPRPRTPLCIVVAHKHRPPPHTRISAHIRLTALALRRTRRKIRLCTTTTRTRSTTSPSTSPRRAWSPTFQWSLQARTPMLLMIDNVRALQPVTTARSRSRSSTAPPPSPAHLQARAKRTPSLPNRSARQAVPSAVRRSAKPCPSTTKQSFR